MSLFSPSRQRAKVLALPLLVFLVGPAAIGPAAGQPLLEPVPFPDLEVLETEVAAQLGAMEDFLKTTRGDETASREERAEAFGELGRYYQAYDLQEPAAACYRNAARLAPEDFRWHYYLGYVQQSAGRHQEAREAYGRALSSFPDSLAAAVHLGEVELAEGRLEEAETAFRRALRTNPSAAAAQAGLGQVALSRRNYAEAVEALEAALAAVPAANRLHYPLALAYRGLGQTGKARDHLARRGAVGVRPPDRLIDEIAGLRTGERVHLLRGRRAFAAGRFDEAAEEFRRAVAGDPESARARINLAAALAETGETEAATAELRRAIGLNPGSATARYNLGALLARQGSSESVKEAAELLAQAIELDPTDRGALFELADLLRRRGLPEEALTLYRKALELDPDSERALLGEADSLGRAGHLREAAAVLEAALAKIPGSGLLAHALARLLAAGPDPEIRDGERAFDLAQRVFAARSSPTHAATLALALAELGRCEQAAELQAEAIEAGLDGPSAGDSLESYLAGPPCRP